MDFLFNSTQITFLLTALTIILSGFLIAAKLSHPKQPRQAVDPVQTEKPRSIMQSERTDLAPPKDDPITIQELTKFNGEVSGQPIYVAIKGTVFDVSHKTEIYGKGGSYNIFAGKDGSNGLGKSSLKPEDAISDYGDLPANERKVLDDWHAFFSKRYNVVGRVSDLPSHKNPQSSL